MGGQDETFDNYEVTTVNPGIELLFGTVIFCLISFVLLGFITFRNRSSLREIIFRHVSGLDENIFLGDGNNTAHSDSNADHIAMSNVQPVILEEEIEVEGESVNVVTQLGKRDKTRYSLGSNANPNPITEDPQEDQYNASATKSPPQPEFTQGDNDPIELIQIDVDGESINVVTKLGRQGKKKYCISKISSNNATHEREPSLTMEDFSPITLIKNAYPPIEDEDTIETNKGDASSNQTAESMNINPSSHELMAEGFVTGEKKRTKKAWWKSRRKKHQQTDQKKHQQTDQKVPKGFSVRKETRKILNLAVPWSFTSLVSEGSSLMVIIAISHILGVAEMIAYTYVWYIISILFVANRALYNSIFHHINISVALETEDGNMLTGKYIKLSLLLNLILAIPSSVAAVFLVDPILTKIGYGDRIVHSCQVYAALASVSNILETSLSSISCILDITGHARFNAVFDFWETVITVLTAIFIMPLFNPSLISLGLVFLAQDLVMIALFLFITMYWKGWFESYKKGFFSRLYLNDAALVSVLKYAMPFIWSEIIGEFEWTILAYFATYQGEAEAATWILLYYIWSLTTIIPENYGSAASVRAVHHITQGNVPAAKSIILRTFKIVVAMNIILVSVLFCFRRPLCSLLSPNETLIQMLVEIVPYICLCEPFLAIGTVASSLNEGIGLYEKSVSVYFWVTVLVTLPSAWIFTYYFNYNIEGLASSLCIGSVVYGVINVDIFMNKKIKVKQETNTENVVTNEIL